MWEISALELGVESSMGSRDSACQRREHLSLPRYGAQEKEGGVSLKSHVQLRLLLLVLFVCGPGEAAAEETQELSTAEEEPEEGVKTENNDPINLKVAEQGGPVRQFKIKRHTPLHKLMKACCEWQGLSTRQIRFQFDGEPINETSTPAQLEMEAEDTIDVFQQQTRGVY
ncbi:small ubiquitin-related modifier 2-like [Diceros bicornis minor]|uniref:small ubiquitin-related modifier 2-like n=1 Tax=Diceros bicornis minor TaxID=77932 RepID=UPI0026EC376F|nr:small ubiquitin-related modifier 2-like [Diceros bicornis minor]